MAADTKQDEVERFEFPLKTPIKSFGDEISVLKWRKPMGIDLVRVGNPVIFTPHVDPPRIEHDMAKMITMLARLTDVPSSSLQTMDPNDLTSLMWDVTPFFMPTK